MTETDGAKVIPGAGSRTLSVRDEAILYDLVRGVKPADVAKQHDLSLRRVYNLKYGNRDRLQQIEQAELQTLQVLKHETFADLWIMNEAPRMAGFNEMASAALRKFLELDAACYTYDPETGERTAARTLTRHEAANWKLFFDMYRTACRDVVELSGRCRLGLSLGLWR
jgi:hypothetical protein